MAAAPLLRSISVVDECAGKIAVFPDTGHVMVDRAWWNERTPEHRIAFLLWASQRVEVDHELTELQRWGEQHKPDVAERLARYPHDDRTIYADDAADVGTGARLRVEGWSRDAAGAVFAGLVHRMGVVERVLVGWDAEDRRQLRNRIG